MGHGGLISLELGNYEKNYVYREWDYRIRGILPESLSDYKYLKSKKVSSYCCFFLTKHLFMRN